MDGENKFKNSVSKYVEKAKSIVANRSLLENKIDTAWEKAKNLDPGLRDLMENVETFIQIIKAYINGTYKDVDQKTIIFLIAGILYFINPFDIIPDFLPLIGFADDAAVLIFILGKVKNEIDKFNSWKINQEIEIYESESEI
ncbi:MAG: YkvA family protein [Cytophagales bacterium]